LDFFSKLAQLIKLQTMIKCFGDDLCLHHQGKIKCRGSASNWHKRSSQKVLLLSVTVQASRLVSHWSHYYDAALKGTVLNCSTTIWKGLPGMLSPYHNTSDYCNITVSYTINSDRNYVCLEQNIHKFGSCLHAIFIPFLPHFKKSTSNNHHKLWISWFYHGNKIFVIEFQDSIIFYYLPTLHPCHTSYMWESLSTASGNRLEMEASPRVYLDTD
jgi:hypothetical protein